MRRLARKDLLAFDTWRFLNAPPITFTTPLSARLMSPPVIAVTPKSTSPEAIATAIGSAAWNVTNSASSPCAVK